MGKPDKDLTKLKTDPRGKVVLACPQDEIISQLAGLSLSESCRLNWVYLGPGYSRMLELEKGELSRWQRISISEKLQETARQFRRPFIEWIGELGRRRNCPT